MKKEVFFSSSTNLVTQDGLENSLNEGVGMGERLDIPLPVGTFRLCVVLVGVSHPGNLGAICRTMLNYGFEDLRLVHPSCSPDDQDTRNRAKHAGRLLDECQVFDSLDAAVVDCSLVVGTSGKREVGDKTLFRHFVMPWELSDRLEGSNSTVALVFGEEGKGLSTEDLNKCDILVTLPTWEGYPIANLSHATTALLYELHRSRVILHQGSEPSMPDVVPLERTMTPQVRVVLQKAIHQYAAALSWSEERRASFRQTMIRNLMKSMPTDQEATRLVGGFVEATTALEHANQDERWMKNRRRKLR